MVLQYSNYFFHLQRVEKGRLRLPTPSTPTSNESFQATRPLQIWKTFIAPRPNSIMCMFMAALMHRGIGWPPGLTNFAVRLCGLWEIPRITSDPPQAPKAIYLSKVRGSWVTAVWEYNLGTGCSEIYCTWHTLTQTRTVITPWIVTMNMKYLIRFCLHQQATKDQRWLIMCCLLILAFDSACAHQYPSSDLKWFLCVWLMMTIKHATATNRSNVAVNLCNYPVFNCIYVAYFHCREAIKVYITKA